MRALRLLGAGNLQLTEYPNPVARPGQLVIRVDACGICGTDRHIYSGEYPSTKPVTLGHEFAGTVTDPSTSTFEVGTRVAVDPNISCGVCRACRIGSVALCEERVALGVDLDGGLAAAALVPISQVYPLPDGMPIEFGALCEPLACCLRASDLAGIRPGMHVVVLGGGIAGQLLVQLARLAGAIGVTLVTRQESRRVLAESLGATASFDPRRGDVVRWITGPDGVCPGGADVVFECVGSVETFEQSVALAARGGTVLIFGVAPVGALARISPFEIFARELRIVGSYLNPHTHGRAVELAGSGVLALEPLITHRLGLEDLGAVIRSSPMAGEVKALFVQ